MVYPTPQMKLKTKHLYPNLHLLPDPSIFAIEDVVFGVTSVDVLLHLSKEEISWWVSCKKSYRKHLMPHPSTDVRRTFYFRSISSQEGGRLSRLSKHLLQQRSFYPLTSTREVPMDPILMEHARLDISPHVLIVPSDLRYFIQVTKTEICRRLWEQPVEQSRVLIMGRLSFSKSTAARSWIRKGWPKVSSGELMLVWSSAPRILLEILSRFKK